VKENHYLQERESPQYKKLMMKEHTVKLTRRRKKKFPQQLRVELMRQ
jgi:hypothetical protein